MSIQLYARAYDTSANGFFFSTVDDYNARAANIRNDCGQPVEEFEISFINGEDIDAELFEALKIHQGNFPAFFEACEEWNDDEKIKVIIAVGEAGYKFDLATDSPSDIDVDLYQIDSLRDLAMQFVDDGLFGDIPDNIRCYLDFDAIARDLGMDCSEATIAGTRYIYRCN